MATNSMKYAAKSELERIVGYEKINSVWTAIKPFVIDKKL